MPQARTDTGPTTPTDPKHRRAENLQACRVGQIPGLRPRHRPGQGEVAAADVQVVDELDAATHRITIAWLLDKPSLPLRRTRLRILASYLRWLTSADPATAPLTAERHVDTYCLTALATGLPPTGKPLARATVMRRRAILASFYAYARQARATPSPHRGVHPPTPYERRLLRAGAAHLAEQGHVAEAAAVALLEATGTTVTALGRLTARDIHLTDDTGLALITLHAAVTTSSPFPSRPTCAP